MTKPETPILALKDTKAPSVFQPANLLREARRQSRLAHADVPELCLLDPDGDIVRAPEPSARRAIQPWACYHTEMWRFHGWAGVRHRWLRGRRPVRRALAEQMFASGCRSCQRHLGRADRAARAPPYFILIDRALSDEGTSYHYLPPSRFADADPEVPSRAGSAWPSRSGTSVPPGRRPGQPMRLSGKRQRPSPPTRNAGILAVEMEAAALYAFSRARGKPVPWPALPTSPTPWRRRREISKKAKLTARWICSCWRRRQQRLGFRNLAERRRALGQENGERFVTIVTAALAISNLGVAFMTGS